MGQAGVWGLSPRGEVMYRDGSQGLPREAEGSGWTKVDGILSWICSGEDGLVWGVCRYSKPAQLPHL